MKSRKSFIMDMKNPGSHTQTSSTPHHDDGHHAHPDNPELASEHTTFLELMAARAMGKGEGVQGVAKPIQSGDWSDPATWGGLQNMPRPDMTIVIPQGIDLTVDSSPGVKLMSVVVYGGLDFATDQDITFIVDEILAGDGSTFHIGTPENPVTGDVDIIIREDTPAVTDHARIEIDPTQLGKGIVTHGEVRIEGVAKADHLKVSVDPMAGDTSLTFDQMPNGWQPGDKIVITGTHIEGDIPRKHSLEQAYQYGDLIKDPLPDWIRENFLRDDPNWDPDNFDFFDPETYPAGPGDWRFDMEEFKTQDEIRVVTDVSQNPDGTFTVHFDQPLDFDHDAPKDVGAAAGREPIDMFASVANYTRSISITSEVAHADAHPGGAAFADDVWVDDNAGFGADEIHDRGHVMFMHNANVEVRHAEFAGLGRTDKSRPLDSLDWDWTIEGTRPTFKENYYTRWKFEFERDEDGNILDRNPLEIENMPGRYGVHFHRTGTDTSSDPAILEGASVWGSPGWGIVHHDSHLNVIDNAVFGIRGGGIVSETGNETGSWNGNIVIKTSGSSDNLFDSGGTPREHGLDDTFHGGDAFGFESRLIESSGNIAVSAQAFGFKFIGPNGNNGDAPAQAFLDAQGYDPFWGDSDIVMTKIPNRTFVDNESYASNFSFGSTLHKDFPNTQAVTLIDNFHSWHSDTGVQLAYARGYLFKDNVYVGDTSRPDAHGYRSHNGEPIGQKGIDPSTDTDLNRGVNNHFENLESDFTAPPADIWVGNTKTNVVNPFVDAEEQRLIDENGGTYLKTNDYTFGTIFHDDLEALPRDIQHLQFVQDGKLDLTLSRRDSSITMEGIVEDALLDGSYVGQYRSVYDDPIAALITNSSQGTLYKVNANWSNMLNRDGYYTDAEGTKYLLVDLVISSKITGTVGVHKVAVDLADDFLIPPLAKHMGELPLGLSADNRFSDLVVVDLRELGSSGNQLTPMEQAHAKAKLYPEPAEDAGQYAFEIADNYQAIEFGNQFNKNGNQDRGEMATFDTDVQRSIDIGGASNITLSADGNQTFRSEFGIKLKAWNVDDLFTQAMMHGGQADVHLVAGGQSGDDNFTLLIMTPEADFLRIEGSHAADAIQEFYDAHPEIDAPTYTFPEGFGRPDDGDHDHDDGDHGDGDHGDGDTPTNTAPHAHDATLSVAEDSQATLTAMAMDADGDILTYMIVSDPIYGNATIDSSTGEITYTPYDDFFGSDDLTYMVMDGRGGSDTGTVQISVTPVNDDPIARDDRGFNVTAGQTLTIPVATLLANDSDLEGDTLTLTAVDGAMLDGETIFLNGITQNGSFTYSISDNQGGTDTATVFYTATPADDDMDDQNQLTDEEITVAVTEALNHRYGLSTGPVEFIGFTERGITVNLGDDIRELTQPAALTAIANYNPESKSHGGADTKDRNQSIAVLDTDDAGDRVWLGGGTHLITVDADTGLTLKNVVDGSLRHTGSRENVTDLLDFVLSDTSDNDDDVSVLAGGAFGDDFVTLALDNGRASDIVVLKGSKIKSYLDAFHTKSAQDGVADVFQVDTTQDIMTISDFNSTEGDELDLSTLFQTNTPQTETLSDFMKRETSDSTTTLLIDRDGGGNDFVGVVTLLGLEEDDPIAVNLNGDSFLL